MATMETIQMGSETCGICGGVGELRSLEELDSLDPALPPLRATVAALAPHQGACGPVCVPCSARLKSAREVSWALRAQSPALGDRVRALRRRLHDLTQKIDVFIVVGGAPRDSAGPPLYAEDDIIMVERGALAAADDDALERAANARGDAVYQCSVCPEWFARAADLRAHLEAHPHDSVHCCWTCGAQFETRAVALQHSREHSMPTLHCYLCGAEFGSADELRRHEPYCANVCPACGEATDSRAELAEHAATVHGPGAPPPLICAVCFASFESAEALSAHALRHKQARQFVCGYDGCILRFASRATLLSHIRKCHAGDTEPPAAAPLGAQPVPCAHCNRTFGSRAAMRRHVRVHRGDAPDPDAEYLEVETLDQDDGPDAKPI